MSIEARPPSLFGVPAAAEAETQIARQLHWLHQAEELAESGAARGRFDDACAVAASAARIALFAHPGTMCSPRLERVLAQASESLEQVARSRPVAQPPERVLHVATETYETGGHTRVMWRWLARDAGRAHSVATTHQNGVLPDGLRKAVRASGGRVTDLPRERTMLERAQELRALAADADLVVLHQHTFDPIPTVALVAMRDRPLIVLNDHAGSAFWFGRTIADVVVGAGRRMSAATARRGIAAERYACVPFPVSGGDGHGRDPAKPVGDVVKTMSRQRALRALGWPEDSVLVFTAGDDYKYRGPDGVSLLSLVEPVLAKHAKARLLAVGARPEGEWAAVAERTGGQVKALGPRTGIELFFTAADVYLDSFPFGGNGATQEASAHGLPVLGLATTELEAQFCRSLPVFGAHVQTTLDAYRDTLDRLLGDQLERKRMGEESRTAVLEVDRAWPARMEGAYAQAATLGPVDPGSLPEPPEAPTPADILVQAQNAATGQALGPAKVEPLLGLLSLTARHDGVRALFATLAGPAWLPVPSGRVAAAFGAPAPEPEPLRTVVADFAALALAGVVAEKFVIGMRPQDADAAVPVLEAALAAHPGLNVDLVLDADPGAACPAGALELA